MIIKVPIYVELAKGLNPAEISKLVELLSDHFEKDLRKKKIPSRFDFKLDKELFSIECDAKVVKHDRALDFLRKGK